MRPASFDYVLPRTLDEALDALGTGTALAGGQSLMPLLKRRLRRPTLLVDLNAIEALRGIHGDGTPGLHIGAMARHREVAGAPEIAERAPVLAAAAIRTGDVQVRNRGTIGGNVGFGDPRANMSAALIAAGAVAVVRRGDGERRVPVEELFAETGGSALASGDLLTGFEVPAQAAGASAYEELAVQPDGVPIVNVAVSAPSERPGELRIAIGGLLRVPCRATAVEEAVRSDGRARPAIERAIAQLTGERGAFADLHGDARYRSRTAAVLVERALRRTDQEVSP